MTQDIKLEKIISNNEINGSTEFAADVLDELSLEILKQVRISGTGSITLYELLDLNCLSTSVSVYSRIIQLAQAGFLMTRLDDQNPGQQFIYLTDLSVGVFKTLESLDIFH